MGDTAKRRKEAWRGRFFALLESNPPAPEQQYVRIRTMERDVVLPVKAILLLVFGFFLVFGIGELPILRKEDSTSSGEGIQWLVALEAVQKFYFVYLFLNVVVGIMLFNLRKIPIKVLQW